MDYDNFADYIVNLQLSPHGTVHVFTGGSFGECTDTYEDLKTSLSNNTLWGKIMHKVSDIEKMLWEDQWQTCPDPGSCAGLAQDSCSCYCKVRTPFDNFPVEFDLETNGKLSSLITKHVQ